ncbi:MAG: cyclic nucleotide-binding domain-containing protein [Mariprofundales bacterium]|nr:cyclic nucleotide-binding domain-containing protein [Mariprofundales bacterium]
MSETNRIFQIYRDLLPLFPDDMHLARPMIKLLQQAGRESAAAALAMNMARRMQSAGRHSEVLGFLAICRQLNHPDQESIQDMESMAKIMVGSAPSEEMPQRVFSLVEELSDQEVRAFLLQGEQLEVSSGRAVVQQGEISNSFFLTLRGSMDVEMTTSSGECVLLANLKAGEYFGEFACIYATPRSATVRAHEQSHLLKFSDKTIHDLMDQSPIAGERLMRVVQQRMVKSLTFEHPAFAELVAEDRQWLAKSSRVRQFKSGEMISQDCSSSAQWLIMMHGEQEWLTDLKRSGEVATGAMVYGGSKFLRRDNSMVRCVKDSLVCEAPPAIFTSFMQAYGGFDRWVKQQKVECN